MSKKINDENVIQTPNKVYFFIIDDDHGGVYIADKNYKSAKMLALGTDIINMSQTYNAFIEIRGYMCKQNYKPVYTQKQGELDVIDLNELGLLWWSCDNELENGKYCNGDDFEFIGNFECKCKKCGRIIDIPYVGS